MQKFEITFKNTKLVGDTIGTNPKVLLLHGAGTASRSRFNTFRSLLYDAEIASCAFDFIGHGETGGDLQASSLEQRTNQALAVIKELFLGEPISIIAASMSGYTAIKLTQYIKVENLIFLAPAVYTPKAYNLPFGSGFSGVIREKDSWQQTDAWDVLENFQGRVIIFIAEHDQVISRGLLDEMYVHSRNAKHREMYVVKGADHPLGKYLEENEEELRRVVSKVIEIVKP